MPKTLRRFLVALATLAGLVLVVVIAWGLDLRGHDGKIVRNTVLAGRDIGGMTRAQLEPIVADVAEEFEGADIRVLVDDRDEGDEGGFTTDASELGVSVSSPSTLEAAFDVGRDGSPVTRLAGWIRSFVSPRAVSLRVSVDEAAVYRTVRDEDPGPREEPTEPRIVLEDGRLEVADGKNGEGIDAADVIDALPDAAAKGEPFVVRVERGDVEPRYSNDDVEALIDEARTRIDEPVSVKADDVETSLRAATVRSWVRSRATDDGLELFFDPELALDDLGAELAKAGTPATETRFTVEGGAVQLIPGKTGTKCCAESAVDVVEEALLRSTDSEAGTLELALTERQPNLTEAEARELQIVEPIASFTTKHPPNQPRVANIHRIADIIRGQVILPDGEFSVNGFVGRRTTERGFVSAPVIEEGRFSEGVGGGISQFATTLFNAAFEGGLDFGEYQSHSIYISRYPYGREATLSYPHPDLVLENPSPHGVLIWPTYTGDSITVTLYSKKYVEVSQTGQTKSPSGNCTRVVTERTRRFIADGRTDTDTVVARYRPAEGVNC